jgi:WAS protein family homolog 1
MKEISIPIIAQDLKQDEVCIRAIKTFEYLDKVVDEVFNRIDARIAKNMTRISDINNR